MIKKAHTEDPSTQFICAIRAAPDPAIVLANDYQIHDMVTFSTSSSEFCVLTIDLTFSLGEFHVQAVTPITYRHLLLETKRTGTNPVFLGPTLIHYRKTFAAYLFFASTLIGLSPKLQGVNAFGTDGEQALADAFNHEFPFSQRLICSVHVHQNIKQKCNELQIPSDLSQKILNDIFGIKIGDVFVEGMEMLWMTMIFKRSLIPLLQLGKTMQCQVLLMLMVSSDGLNSINHWWCEITC